MKTKNYLVAFAACLLTISAQADNIDTYGARPYFSLTQNIAARWSLSFFYAETINMSSRSGLGHVYPSRDEQSYSQLGAVYKYSPNLNFTLGYVYQKSNPFSDDYTDENRIWEQLLYAHDLFNGRLSHRLRFEQRWIQKAEQSQDPLATRLRYQIGYTAPFIGREIVANTWFYNLYHEFYFSPSGKRISLYSGNWTYAGIGYRSESSGTYTLGPLLQQAPIDTHNNSRTLLVAQLGWSYSF